MFGIITTMSKYCLLVFLLMPAIVWAMVPTALEMRGPFPIMSTPYLDDGSVDYDGLVREAEGGSFGSGKAWKLDKVEISELQKAELDILFAKIQEAL